MRTNTARVVIRWAEFDRLCDARGWYTNSKRARQLGLAPSTLSNLRSGKYGPGSFVINQMLTTLECPYASLFEIDIVDEVA
jgi:transcriptional regulator with XRE-family HTH domain